jgi:hypothetical protein
MTQIQITPQQTTIVLRPQQAGLTITATPIAIGIAPPPPHLIEVGQQGPPGPAAGESVLTAFAYGDASPKPIGTGLGLIRTVTIWITVPFAAGTALHIGTATEPAALLDPTQLDPTQIGEYQTNPVQVFPAATPLFLTIALPVGAAQGQGFVGLEG